MKTIDEIHRQLSDGAFEFTRHALKRAVERNIGEEMIRQAGGNEQLKTPVFLAGVFTNAVP